jgi:hypothetical protein
MLVIFVLVEQEDERRTFSTSSSSTSERGLLPESVTNGECLFVEL